MTQISEEQHCLSLQSWKTITQKYWRVDKTEFDDYKVLQFG